MKRKSDLVWRNVFNFKVLRESNSSKTCAFSINSGMSGWSFFRRFPSIVEV